MASYKDILNEKENQNWMKGSLALRITKAGLRNLVEMDSSRVQQKIQSSIIQARNLAPGTSCSLCLTENLLVCPTRGICSYPRNCKYHNSALKMFQPCPSQICDNFLKEIIAVHRFRGPSWKNTKAEQWCTNHWQVAKCFFPPDGYQNVSSFDETDYNGIISFMINCTEIQNSLSFNISTQPNILTKARDIGRSLRHSSDLKLGDTDLSDYFATLTTLLKDSKYLASDCNAQQAVTKLTQLEKDTLLVSSEDVRELLEEARGMIEYGKHELGQSWQIRTQKLDEAVETAICRIEEKTSESLQKLIDFFIKSDLVQKEEVQVEMEHSSDKSDYDEREQKVEAASNNPGRITKNVISTSNTSDQSVNLLTHARMLNCNITINMGSSPNQRRNQTRSIDSESD